MYKKYVMQFFIHRCLSIQAYILKSIYFIIRDSTYYTGFHICELPYTYIRDFTVYYTPGWVIDICLITSNYNCYAIASTFYLRGGQKYNKHVRDGREL